jgi:hypothetical protein
MVTTFSSDVKARESDFVHDEMFVDQLVLQWKIFKLGLELGRASGGRGQSCIDGTHR